MYKTIAATLGTLMLAGAAQGCAAQPDDSKFLQPIPQQGEAALAIAGTQAPGATTQSARADSLKVQGIGGSAGGDYASFYEFTRQITDGVDSGTFGVLAAIAAVTSTPPTSVTSTEAIWGPGGDALDPIDWRVTVTQVATDQFSYEVDGRPHGSTSNSAFEAIVKGTGYGTSSPSYRSGTLTLFGDVLQKLDPTRSNGGTAKITYDARTWPKTVTADITTSDGSGQWYDATVSHAEDGSGDLSLTALADVSSPPDGTNENVDEMSRWTSTGAGRADVSLTGGDFGTKTVLVSQCWSSSFAQTYYTDSVGFKPTEGSAASCAFAEAQFSQ